MLVEKKFAMRRAKRKRANYFRMERIRRDKIQEKNENCVASNEESEKEVEKRMNALVNELVDEDVENDILK